jgi:uncharacterized protein YgiM (DUF1202 family)
MGTGGIWCVVCAPRHLVICGAMLLALLAPLTAAAQSCTKCVIYPITELNLRQEPSQDAAVLRFIPQGAEVERTDGKDVNGYAPVIYDGVPGWAVALGFVTSKEEIGTGAATEPAPAIPATSSPAPNPAPAPNPDLRLTLTPLFLRSGPDLEADPILSMPQGAGVILTREGAENGYVTVDYDGVTGWAYADLLAREDEFARFNS